VKHASLFSGIGGFEYAAKMNGIDNIFAVEIDKFCHKVLAKNYPELKLYEDIKEFKEEENGFRGTVDIISGGFPCQPFSVAGKREGSDDNRHLWPEMFRVIREIQPTWVIAENVPGLLTIENGVVFNQCILDLESAGYETQSFIIPAISVNAPHKRDRLWIIAYSDSRGLERTATLRRDSEYVIGEDSTSENPLSIRCDSSIAEENAEKRGQREFSSGNAAEFSNEDTSHSNETERQLLCGQESGQALKGDSNDITRTRSTGQNSPYSPEFGCDKREQEDNGSLKNGESNGFTEKDAVGNEKTEFSDKGRNSNTSSTRLKKPGYEGIGELSTEGREGLHDRPEQSGSEPTDSESKRWNDRATGQQVQQVQQASGGQTLSGRDDTRIRARENPEWDKHWYEVAAMLCRMDDGISEELYKLETSDRVARLKALGNAIVPFVADKLFKAIIYAEQNTK